MDSFDIKNKVVLITGSSGGIGYTLAKGMAMHGATVIINGRNETKIQNTVIELIHRGLNVHGYVFDVNDSAEVNQQIVRIEKEVGPIDVLVNNAGIQIRKPLEDFAEKDWKQIIDTNLTSAFIVSKAVVKGMIKRRQGKIINICSLMSELGRPTIAPYAASKGGLRMLTRAMCVEWARYNIQINGVGPGYFITDMTSSLAEDPQFDSWLKNRTPAARWGDPAELVGTAVFLASKASSYINGQIIYVDGGLLAAI